MRTKKPFVLSIPSQFMEVLEHYLDNNKVPFRYERVNFYYLINYIANKQLKNKNFDYVSIDKKELKKITKTNIHKYINLLVGLGLLESDNTYKTGSKSKWYRLNEYYCNGLVLKEIDTNSKLHNAINRQVRNANSHVNRLPHHLQLMRKEFLNMEYDFDSAFKWVWYNSTGKKFFSYSNSLYNFQDKRFRYFKRNKTNNRLDTNLTTLKSELRHFIIGDYVSIDLSNSQPFLLGILINSILNYNKDTLCRYLSIDNIVKTFGYKEVKDILKSHQNINKTKMATFINYLTTTKKGLLYDSFIKVFNGQLKRKEVKQMFFKVLFSMNGFKFNTPYKKEKDKFKSVYPIVGNIVEVLKAKDYKTLPIYLQKIESYLFIDVIAKKLVENNIIPLTVHDSVIVKRKDKDKTLQIMEDVFNKMLGTIPTFKVETL